MESKDKFWGKEIWARLNRWKIWCLCLLCGLEKMQMSFRTKEAKCITRYCKLFFFWIWWTHETGIKGSEEDWAKLDGWKTGSFSASLCGLLVWKKCKCNLGSQRQIVSPDTESFFYPGNWNQKVWGRLSKIEWVEIMISLPVLWSYGLRKNAANVIQNHRGSVILKAFMFSCFQKKPQETWMGGKYDSSLRGSLVWEKMQVLLCSESHRLISQDTDSFEKEINQETGIKKFEEDWTWFEGKCKSHSGS